MLSRFNILLSPSLKGFSVMNVDRIRLNLWRSRGRQNRRQRTVIRANRLEMELSRGRGAPGTMQRKRIARSRMLWERKIPGDNLRRAYKVKRRRCKRRHVQRLADMASGVGAFGVFVEEAAASSKVQQRSASQYRQRSTHHRPSKHESQRIHKATIYLNIPLASGRGPFHQMQHSGPVFLDPATIPS
jgi:hypothetical protein